MMQAKTSLISRRPGDVCNNTTGSSGVTMQFSTWPNKTLKFHVQQSVSHEAVGLTIASQTSQQGTGTRSLANGHTHGVR